MTRSFAGISDRAFKQKKEMYIKHLYKMKLNQLELIYQIYQDK